MCDNNLRNSNHCLQLLQPLHLDMGLGNNLTTKIKTNTLQGLKEDA